MSTPRRPHLTPLDIARLKATARCPDCPSRVTVDRDTAQARVYHDETCPTLRALQRRGTTAQLVVVGDDPVGDVITDLAERLGVALGTRVQASATPYPGGPT